MTPHLGSPAIDSADPALCAARPVDHLDQLGRQRPQDGDGDGVSVCDRGALERHLADLHTVTASASVGGTIHPLAIEVPHGAVATFTVSPNSGHHIASVDGCGGTLATDRYTTAPVLASCAVRAVFAANPTPKPRTVFSDSFESKTFAAHWTQDGQGAWQSSLQRAKPGRRSAEADGPARDAALISAPIHTRGARSASITFVWFIETSLDTGEYLAFDISLDGGSTWSEGARLRANLDPENRWRTVSLALDLSGLTAPDALRLRIRASMSDAVEDANVDNVRVLVH
jgi:hypothetical protein